MLTRRGFLQTAVAAPLGLSIIEARLRAAPLPARRVESVALKATDLLASNITDLRIESEIEETTQRGDTWVTHAPTGRCFFDVGTIGVAAPAPGEYVRIRVNGAGFTGRVHRVEQNYGSVSRLVRVRISGEVVERC